MRCAAALALMAVAVCGCASAGDGSAAPAVVELRATLVDRDAPSASGRGWSTTWRLCWEASQRAAHYELQALTSEGAGRIRHHARRCYSLEVAAGDGRAATGSASRARQLAASRSQLAYRVRAVAGDGTRGPWSRAVEAGAPE